VKLVRALPLVLLLLAPGSPAAATQGVERGPDLVLENGALRLTFARESGALLQVENLALDLALCPGTRAGGGPPRLELLGEYRARPLAFRHEVLRDDAGGAALRLEWDYEEGISVEVRAELLAGETLARLWPRLRNEGQRSVTSLVYPALPELLPLAERPEEDVLVHPLVRGMLVRDPVHTLDIRHNPIRSCRYPQAYNGMTHQLVDYHAAGRGGFFFAAFDPHGSEKELAMPLEEGRLGLAWRTYSWDERPGRDLDLDFPFVIGVTTRGDWYESADLYREWAETAPWCAERGPRRSRPEADRVRWLHEEVGLATFGTSASVDQSPWYRAYGELVDARVLHVVGFDGLVEQGRDGDPLDALFAVHPANTAAIEAGGDDLAVFLADLRTTFLLPEIAHEVGREGVEIVQRATPEACPADSLWRLVHAARAVAAVTATGASSFYCDASAPNRELSCHSRGHGHTPGRGRWMNAAYRELYAGTAAALQEACGVRVPLGVELMHEGLLDRFDYYQARGGAGFMGGLEGGFYRGLQLRGLVETVPVFSYLYHEYAPVALDGCGKVSERIGDLFYWMAARVVLAGGIFELNNEFAPPERFPGMSRVGMLHYKARDPFEWLEAGEDGNEAYDPAKGAFLADLAAARTEFGTDFLAHGRMLPPLELDAGEVRLGYSYYNNIDWGGRPNTTTFSDATGTHEVPRVLHSAWREGERLGYFFVNLDAVPVPIEVTPPAAGPGARLVRRDAEGSRPLASRPGEPLALELPARRVVLVEVVPGS
jgi:hypothetical protein